MNADVILCPVDFSPMTQCALELASSLAADSDSQLIILHAEPKPVTVVDEANQDVAGRLAALNESLQMVLPTEPRCGTRIGFCLATRRRSSSRRRKRRGPT